MKINKYIKIFATASVLSVVFLSCADLDKHFEGGTLDDEQLTETFVAIPDRVNAAANAMYTVLGKPNGYFNRAINSERADDMGYPAVALGQDLNSGDMTNKVSDYDWFSVAHL